jgi:transcriptional antiterminator NusG
VRNTEGVTGFVGHGSSPIPLTDEEVRNMGIDNYSVDYDIDVGDYVRIMDGNFKNYTGTVEQINREKQTVKLVTSSMVTLNCEISLIEKLN